MEDNILYCIVGDIKDLTPSPTGYIKDYTIEDEINVIRQIEDRSI